ncbi:MAG: hypothetical protein ACKVOM_02530 [Ferruginibacter sp.]
MENNRSILKELISIDKKTVKVKRDLLIDLGFNFTYHTQQRPAKNGNKYTYCYDYGYLELEKSKILVVRNN